MRLNKRKRNKSLCKTDIKSTETSHMNNTSVETMVLQHSISQLSPNHFQHSNDIGRKFFAGSRFSEAPNPSLLPKPPKHWMSANDSGKDPIDRLQVLPTTNDITNHINGSSLMLSDIKRNNSSDNINIGLKLLQILETNSIVSTSVNYETTRLSSV